MRKRLILIVAVAAALLFPGCRPGAEKAPAAPETRKIANVSVEPAALRDLEEQVVLSGALAPDQEALISAETAGVAERIVPRKGDRVRAGDILAEIDRKNSAATLDRAKAALRQARLAREEAELGVKRAETLLEAAGSGIQQAKLALTSAEKAREKAEAALANQRAQFERVEKLFRDRLASQSAYDDARTALKAAEADTAAASAGAEHAREAIALAENNQGAARLGVDSARLRVSTAQAEIESQEAAVAQAELHWQKGLVTAPFDGYVDDVFFEQGEYVKMEVPVLKLVGVDPMKAEVALAERDVALVEKGQPARTAISSLPGRSLEGRISYVALSADSRTNTYPAEITVPNPKGELKAGMVVEVRFTRRRVRGAVAVPAFAVIPKEDGNVVFVLENGRAVRRRVTTGIMENGWAQIAEGLKAGEQLIVKGQRDLQDGQEVRVQP